MEGFDDNSELSAAELMEFCNQVHTILMHKIKKKIIEFPELNVGAT